MTDIHKITAIEPITVCGVVMTAGQTMQMRSWVQEAQGEPSDLVKYLRLGTMVIDQGGAVLGLQEAVTTLNAMWSNKAGSAAEMAELSTESVYGHLEIALPTGTSWVIDHELPVLHPSVMVIDTGGNEIEVSVSYSTTVARRITLSTTTAFSGTAILS